jgi:Ras-related protein Rab-6A
MLASENSSDIPRFKVVFLGNAGVGKTSIINRRQTGDFGYGVRPTVGASHVLATIPLDDVTVQLLLWDTAGQERFQSLTPQYLRDAHVVVIVASLFDYVSIRDITDKWRKIVVDERGDVPIIAVLNKVDLQPEDRKTETETYANELKSCEIFASVYVVSALNGCGIDELFVAVAQTAIVSKTQSEAALRLGSVDLGGPSDRDVNLACC